MIDAAPQESCGAGLYGEEGKKGVKEGKVISEELSLLRLSSAGCFRSLSRWLFNV